MSTQKKTLDLSDFMYIIRVTLKKNKARLDIDRVYTIIEVFGRVDLDSLFEMI